MKPIKISAQFGHEIMAVRFASAYGVDVLIIPNKDSKEEYEAEAQKIYDNMSFFYHRLRIVPFEERENIDCRDIIGELKAGKLPDEEWNMFFKGQMSATRNEGLPRYSGLNPLYRNLLFVPQKLISDGACGVTAQQQSLSPEVFSFLKEEQNTQLVLGQHFHKVNDCEAVRALAEEFNLYVPGLTENPEVFGIRGVKHEMYYDLYRRLWGSVGIAGTHTWYMLAMFPEIPQIILYNKNGVENWEAIAEAARKAKHQIYAIGFDEKSDMTRLSRQIALYMEPIM